MTRNDKIAAFILGAAAAVAIVRYIKMPEEEKQEFLGHLKDRTNELLSNADQTVDHVNSFLSDYDQQPENAWVDKLYILKKMFRSLYGSDKHFLL